MTTSARKRSGPTTPHADRSGVRVDLYLPTELMSWVDTIARNEGASRTAVIRDLLWVACVRNPQPATKKRVATCVRSGPR